MYHGTRRVEGADSEIKHNGKTRMISWGKNVQEMLLMQIICFEPAEEETDMLVRDRGLLYYRLLKTNVQEAKRIIRGSQKMVTQFTSPPKAVSKRLYLRQADMHASSTNGSV